MARVNTGGVFLKKMRFINVVILIVIIEKSRTKSKIELSFFGTRSVCIQLDMYALRRCILHIA